MNAPSAFQSLMNEVFRDMLRKSVLVFFDDILIYSLDWRSHILHLTNVLDALKKEQLVANRKMCYFSQTNIEYLGHIISKDSVPWIPTMLKV